jgi:hypothetical protein
LLASGTRQIALSFKKIAAAQIWDYAQKSVGSTHSEAK